MEMVIARKEMVGEKSLFRYSAGFVRFAVATDKLDGPATSVT